MINPRFDRKRKRNTKRLLIAIVLLALIVIGSWFGLRSNSSSPSVNVSQTANSGTTAQLVAAESGLLPWQLQAPLSRMAVYPGTSANQLVLAGGLSASGQSVNQIYTLNTTNGALNMTGNLPGSVHDAASAQIGKSFAIFGGGSASPLSNATVFGLNGQVVGSSNLPQRRADSVALNVSGKTYIIGGYSGTQADSEVLSTTNGTSFSNVGKLAVPVRYPAVVSLGKYIYVFGGESVWGSNNGNPVNAVQIINTTNGSVTQASWKLPVPLEGAMAFVINNEMFLVGGQSNKTEYIPTGVGTTQVPGVNVSTQSLTHNTIWAVNLSKGQFLAAGRLQLPVSNAGFTVLGSHAWLIGGEYNGQVVSSVQMVTPNSKFGIAGQPGAGSPYYGGKLLIADRGNNRLIVMNSAMNITWRYPSSSTSAQTSKAFYFPDDAFFANHGTEIVSNQENNNTIIILGYPSGKVLWTYGHPLQAGSANGYLRAPDDAYVLKNNDVVVADDQNCRVLIINPAGQVVHQIGTPGVCVHNPNVSLGSPNGDTPLYD